MVEGGVNNSQNLFIASIYLVEERTMTTMLLDQIQNGYPGLAKFIGHDLDQGLGIFKQFAELNARNLLYMQAELLCLEQELDVITYVDEHGTDLTTKNFARSVWEMKKPPNRPQWNKVLEIRRKLKDYSMIPPRFALPG
ncbi:hypothetical protein J4E89_006927 [Alternaria sp. Ai002NY15]|nr:hypothetical protein J4E89_006927 [Alternaria sp. Ai002NY15]